MKQYEGAIGLASHAAEYRELGGGVCIFSAMRKRDAEGCVHRCLSNVGQGRSEQDEERTLVGRTRMRSARATIHALF